MKLITEAHNFIGKVFSEVTQQFFKLHVILKPPLLLPAGREQGCVFKALQHWLHFSDMNVPIMIGGLVVPHAATNPGHHSHSYSLQCHRAHKISDSAPELEKKMKLAFAEFSLLFWTIQDLRMSHFFQTFQLQKSFCSHSGRTPVCFITSLHVMNGLKGFLAQKH